MSIQTKRNALQGRAAEALVAGKYRASGFSIECQNYRLPPYGEIDIVASAKGRLYFVEVKSSQTHDRAAALLNAAQCKRLHKMAEIYLSKHGLAMETEIRFDAALVDALGHVRVMPAALNDAGLAPSDEA